MIEYLSVRANWETALLGAMAWLVGVPLLAAIYYHWKVRRIAGGRALRAAQGAGSISENPRRNIADAGNMWSRLRRGEFGHDARQLIERIIWVFVVWAIVAGIIFGILIYVDAQMQQRGGWPEFAGEAEADAAATKP
jgi:hypothetical protein